MIFIYISFVALLVFLILYILSIHRESKRRTVELELLTEKTRILEELNSILQKYINDEYERFHNATLKMIEEYEANDSSK